MTTEEARLICAVVACSRPQGESHVADCPYFGQDNLPAWPTSTCDTCGGTGLVDWAPHQIRDTEEDQQSCPDCSRFRSAAPSEGSDS